MFPRRNKSNHHFEGEAPQTLLHRVVERRVEAELTKWCAFWPAGLRVCVPGRMPISALRPEIGKKSPKNRFWPHPENRAKNRPKIGEIAQRSVFGPFFIFFSDFFPISRERPKSILRRFFSDFGSEAKIGILPGTHTRNRRVAGDDL